MDVFDLHDHRERDADEPSGLLEYIGLVVGLAVAATLVVIAVLLLLMGHLQAAEIAVGAATAPVSTIVDFGPLANLAVQWLAPIILSALGILGTFALTKLKTKLGWQTDALVGQILDKALDNSIGYAAVQIGSHELGAIPIDMKSEAIAHAASYAQSKVPGALDHFGITRGGLEQMVESRLEGLLIDPKTQAAGALPRPIAAT